jgi:hypothetical protein
MSDEEIPEEIVDPHPEQKIQRLVELWKKANNVVVSFSRDQDDR